MIERVGCIARRMEVAKLSWRRLELETIGQVICVGIRVAKRRQIVDFFDELQNASKIMGRVRYVLLLRVR